MFDNGPFGNNPLGKLFDYNKDGKKDALEKAAELTTFILMHKQMKRDRMEAKLSEAGLNLSDLEAMDDEERAAALEAAGLDPNEFEFD